MVVKSFFHRRKGNLMATAERFLQLHQPCDRTATQDRTRVFEFDAIGRLRLLYKNNNRPGFLISDLLTHIGLCNPLIFISVDHFAKSQGAISLQIMNHFQRLNEVKELKIFFFATREYT